MRAQGLNLKWLAIGMIAGLAVAFFSGCHRTETRTDAAEILTPPASPLPRINGAKVFGARPGAPFLFQISASGQRPMEFSAKDLPTGLAIDPTTGLISGSCALVGKYAVKVRARNALETAERGLRIVIGDEIALTPPMGWNSWNIWGGNVSQEKIAAAARALVATGLRDHGWTYLNIDDGWQGRRGGEFQALQPNAKFPDLPALAQEIHGLGLKIGLYSTPWRTSFLGHLGSSADFADGSNEWLRNGQHDEFFHYRFPLYESWLQKYAWLQPLAARSETKSRQKIMHELRTFGQFSFVRQDVAQWNAWGIDYLKYDWVPVDAAHATQMGNALRAGARDIIFTVANNVPFPIAAEISGAANSWRTSGDVKDKWSDVCRSGFTRDRWAKFGRPGHYNDPDMLVVGQVGWGQPRPTRLSPNEQYTQMSLWCLLSAPLLLGCDLEKLDDFTRGLLINDEVLEVDQDSLGKPAISVAHRWNSDVYAKPLEDGSWAVGLFNRGNSSAEITAYFSNLPLTGRQTVRDLWRQKTLGLFEDHFSAVVAPHGVVLVRLTSVK